MRRISPILLSCIISSPVFAAPTLYTCSPEDFGGVADGHTVETSAIQKAIDSCSQHGGGTVKLEPGVWLSGPLTLKSNVSFIIPKNTTLQAVDDKNAFVPAFIGQQAQKREAFIMADNIYNSSISGGGSINGNGDKTWWPDALALRKEVRSGHPEAFTDRYKGIPLANGMPRPWLVEINNSSFIKINNIHLENSPMWNLVLRKSHNIDVDRIQINNPPESPNTDGIDIVSSTDINIKHADISTGDDHIAIKSGIKRASGETSGNINISHSIMRLGHGISIGSETINGIGNVSVSDVNFVNSENGIRVKSGRDRGNLIGPFIINNVSMTNVATPLLITDSYSGQAGAAGNSLVSPIEYNDLTQTTPLISGVSVHNLKATNARYAMILSGLPEAPIKNLKIDNVSITAEQGIQARYVSGDLKNVSIKTVKGSDVTRGPDVNLNNTMR
ncbi:glycoside hydrolase family 28 protein [Pantoea cypripedii]|uniref:Glycoside hydrolase n=1 Tax=Pantoea cypripedii TaxID=55209 RepID=A0A1X1EKE8_PANCY|nr:glycosyl hydrolase family 28 protein [Pantoea cypripedii]MBP2198952.1 polygalacturonase [Pantoea cypripedii]ORM89391.1 glycoside hydrolase [Pantoea cypripedii]